VRYLVKYKSLIFNWKVASKAARRKKVLNETAGISCSASLQFAAHAIAGVADRKMAKAEFFQLAFLDRNNQRNL
jgi:hypothetical protein